MKFAGIVGLLWAAGMAVACWLAYADMARLHDSGMEGTIGVIAKIGELKGPKGSVTRIYDVMLADVRVRIKTGDILSKGAQIPVLYSVDSLRNHTTSDFFNDGVDYIAGKKAETKYQIWIREMSWPFIWFFLIFEAAIIAASVWLLNRRMPNQSPEPTSMAVTPPAAQEPRQPYSRLI